MISLHPAQSLFPSYEVVVRTLTWGKLASSELA
jgi:hypothetical protein